jgi:hypothetical protein
MPYAASEASPIGTLDLFDLLAGFGFTVLANKTVVLYGSYPNLIFLAFREFPDHQLCTGSLESLRRPFLCAFDTILHLIAFYTGRCLTLQFHSQTAFSGL